MPVIFVKMIQNRAKGKKNCVHDISGFVSLTLERSIHEHLQREFYNNKKIPHY